jgi:SAM-dependent methyltransferase
MLSREILGADVVLPHFPVLKSIRGIGMSDSADYAGRLATVFDYGNTEYDREPRLDILHPGEHEFGSYDFILCSEVLEHVVAPVDVAFSNLFRLLKPNGVLLMTVPYKPQGQTLEHFGPMDEFGLAKVGGEAVLVRRKPEGGYEVFDDLVFHGGSGSTLEMRVFSEQDLRSQVLHAGFSSFEIYADSFPEFGVMHDETWSLPGAARKGAFAINGSAVKSWAEQWARLRSDLEFNLGRIHELQRELESRTKWVRDLEKQLEERTSWALSLERAVKAHHPELRSARARIRELHAELRALWTALWYRARRRIGLSR